MERLKGSSLARTVKFMREAGKTTKEIVISCGYGREEEGKIPHYTAFYEELLIVRDNEKRYEAMSSNVNKRRDNVLHYLLSAIEYRTKYEYRNDWADRCDYSEESYSADDNYIVRYYGDKIALFTQTGVQFFIPSMKSLTLPVNVTTAKITVEQWKEFISETIGDISGEMVTVGPWKVPIKIVALAASYTWKNDGYGDFIESVTLYGKRTLCNVKESGYDLEGIVSIKGVKRRAYTSSIMFELPDGRLYNVATIQV
jgi:hypothetical protein